jgi:hypothetical protein
VKGELAGFGRSRDQWGTKDQDAGIGTSSSVCLRLGDARLQSEMEQVASTGINLQTRRGTKAIEEVAWSTQRNFIGGVSE